ncbi:HEAT repeat domain-containing protein [Kribbella turkmenica]|uniref:HEAT repeat domain-containing protein n=1 Tax=Kribbella turkmenica TaxID=2530375 RepID=UPI001F1BEC23|nr:HEAT repeat domain-containing protein [Kribbella turkmenica]
MAGDREHPREIVLRACAEHGEDAVIDFAIAVLTGDVSPEDAFTTELGRLTWLVGPTVGGWAKLDPVNFYWARVWAARIFVYVWRDDVVGALLTVADDPAWRVREHVARITAQRELGQLVDALLPGLEFELPRVRSTTARAVGAAGEAEHADALLELLGDPDHTVRAAAEKALDRMEARLDRSLR